MSDITTGKSVTSVARDVFTLDEGEAVLQFPAALTPASVDDLEDWLNLVVKRLKRRAATQHQPGQVERDGSSE